MEHHEGNLSLRILVIDDDSAIHQDFCKTLIKSDALAECTRASDTVARSLADGTASRLGGDEFTVILPEMNREEGAGVVARRIAEQISQPILIGNHGVIITSSIGIAIFPQDGDTIETLLKKAGMAMNDSKRGGGPDLFRYYQESMNATALKPTTMENRLGHAPEQDKDHGG